jgi:hypothetical protein
VHQEPKRNKYWSRQSCYSRGMWKGSPQPDKSGIIEKTNNNKFWLVWVGGGKEPLYTVDENVN